MAKPELGAKRDCPNCGARFYDLNKNPAHCPKCHTEFAPEDTYRPKRGRGAKAAAETPAEEKPAAETEENEKADEGTEEVALEEADEAIAEPASRRAAALDDDDDTEDDDANPADEVTLDDGVDDVEFSDDGDENTLLEDDDELDDGAVGDLVTKDNED